MLRFNRCEIFCGGGTSLDFSSNKFLTSFISYIKRCKKIKIIEKY